MRLSRLLACGCVAAAIAPALLPMTAASAATGSERIVYVADRSGGDFAYGLYTTTNGLSDPSPVAVIAENGIVDVLQAKLSPDGSLIAALVDSTGSTDHSLQVMNVDGSHRRTVFAATHNDAAGTGSFVTGFSWAADSSSLVFGPAVFSPAASFKLRRYAVAGGAVADVPGSAGMEDPAVAPNGTIAALSNNDGLVVLDPATATSTPTGVAGTPPSAIVESPAWSSDGQSLVYTRDTSTSTADQSSVEVTTLTGSTWSAPTVVGPSNDGTNTWFSEYPTFHSDGTIWFDRYDDTTKTGAPQDIVTATPPTTSGGAWTLVSSSTPADDGSISFGAIDTTAPGAPTLQPFTLAGTTTYINWTGDPDVSKLNLHRTGSDGTSVDFVMASPFADKTTKLGVTYTYTAKAIDGAGNTGATSSNSRSVTAEGIKLVVSNPTSLATAKLPFAVAWGVAGNQGATYTVQYAPAGGAVRNLQAATSATRSNFSPSAGQTYSFRGLVKDSYGNSSAWTGWSKAVVPFDQSKGTFSSSPSWKTVRSAADWLGSIRTTTHNKAAVTFKLTSRGVQIIGDKLPAGAKFAVYVGKTYKGTFTTHATTTKHRQVLYSANFSTLAARTIKIVAVVASGKTLNIDGVAAPK